MKHFKYKNILLVAVLALTAAGCGNGDPVDGFTVHGLGDAETSVYSGENDRETDADGSQTSKNTVNAGTTLKIGKNHTAAEATSESVDLTTTEARPTPPTTSPTTAETTTVPELTVVTEAECSYKILHSGNYSTEYYTYTKTGNIIAVTCSFCQEELGCIDLMKMIQAELEATNRARSAAGLDVLSYNANGAGVANMRAQEIVGNFSHERFEQLTAEEYAAIGFVNTCGENICMFGLNPDSMNAGEYANTLWMESPGHRENILNNAYKTVAIGVYFDAGTKCLYWVQLFGG